MDDYPNSQSNSSMITGVGIRNGDSNLSVTFYLSNNGISPDKEFTLKPLEGDDFRIQGNKIYIITKTSQNNGSEKYYKTELEKGGHYFLVYIDNFWQIQVSR